MKIYFHLPYETNPGETLRAVVFLNTQGKLLRKEVPLSSTDRQHWTGWAEWDADAQISHTYQVLRGGQIVRAEWDARPLQSSLSARQQAYHFYDLWRELPKQSWLASAVFAYPAEVPPAPLPHGLVLRVTLPGLSAALTPYVCGSSAALGAWDAHKALPLTPCAPNEWLAVLPAEKDPVLYKFILKDAAGTVQWEQDSNRTVPPAPPAGQTFVYEQFMPRFTLTPVKAAGVVLPVFSIRSQEDWGCGDFGSLKKLVDWAAATGQKIIQILPVNDTTLTGTWQDSYPYNSVSVYAFHPLYADMAQLPALPPRKDKTFQKRRAKLNALPQVDYEAVTQLKNERLHLAYEQEGKEVLASAPFRQFWTDNSAWLAAYAMFCALRDKYGTADWQSWPEHVHFSEQELFAFFSQDSKERQNAYFYFYVQFVLHTQLLDAHQYARSRGVALKGDIPIGVSPHSADAWMEPALFHLNAQAGAPPDDFSVTGQNWGFPTYNWEEMAKDNYGWWRRRFLHMTRYFDAYRIDHVLGFFRIWQIPLDAVQGLLGQFSPALPLTRQDIASFGFTLDESHLQPYISEDMLQDLFGTEAKRVKKTYLSPLADDLYALQPEYDTQRKIEKAFAQKKDERALKIRDGLYALRANVLFLADAQNPQAYHPRISALQSAAYQALPEAQRAAYERLYTDYFFRRQDDFWARQALAKLPALTQSTPMLCCAEDLGMIAHCVPQVMDTLQMLSLEIQRMPKHLGEAFANTRHYPYLSVATPSTHDMSVLRAWWKEDPQRTQQFWQEVLQREGAAPQDAPADACAQILYQHLHSPAMLCLISWQDWTSMDEQLRTPDPAAERINVPAEPKYYWRYRMALTLEELMEKTDFNRAVQNMIAKSGR